MTQFRCLVSVSLVVGLTGCPLMKMEDDMGGALQWQDPPAPSAMGWDDASAYCESLEQAGQSDWRLPTIDELRSLIVGCDRTVTGGACEVSESCLDASCSPSEDDGSGYFCSCEGMQGPADGCFHAEGYSAPCDCYASASAVAGGPAGDYHWEVCFDRGYVTSSPSTTQQQVRCVRGSSSGGFGGSDNGGPSQPPSGQPGGSTVPGGGTNSFPATQHSYSGTPATRRTPATMAMHGSTSPSSATTTWSSSTQRGSLGGSAIADSGGSCGDGSAFICSGTCCGASVTEMPSTCCASACCAGTAYCDFATGGCGYSCDADAGELDCGDGNCCPAGTLCRGDGQCESDTPTCADGTIDCGGGTCCPSGTTCNGSSCDYPSMCDQASNDCGDGSCCPFGSTCVGGGQCEQPGCDGGVECGDFCCEPGDQCLGGGQCAQLGCEDGELDCGGGFCCPSGTSCDGQQCMEPEPEPEPMTTPDEQPPIGGTPDGTCDTEDLLAALGGASSGNGCVDGCIQAALRCAGAAGCVLTAACQNAETACVTACFQQ
jgi:hypothetical protein